MYKRQVNLCSLSSTNWDYEETRVGGPFLEINQHDIFINCTLITKEIPPFVTLKSLDDKNKILSIIADVGCDPNSSLNPLPIYQQSSSWESPFQKIESLNIEILSIDNLPSILPYESSIDFSSQLLPHLIELHQSDKLPVAWKNALKIFQKHALIEHQD